KTSDKPYRILFEHRPHYLYVMIRCETTSYPIAKTYWTEILSLQHRRGYDRVWIDKDITNSMPAHDVVLLVSDLAHSGCHDVQSAAAFFAFAALFFGPSSFFCDLTGFFSFPAIFLRPSSFSSARRTFFSVVTLFLRPSTFFSLR